VPETPKVSVIIPTYNRADVIARSIRSVLAQTYQDFELIVVDDGSSDGTPQAVEAFEDRRIKLVRHSVNKGAGGARNTGIGVARGEYVAFQDSDDEWLPHKLERQMQIFEALPPEVGVVYSDMWKIDERGTKKYFAAPHIVAEDGMVYKRALGHQAFGIGIQSSVIRRECLGRVGRFDERLPALEDSELFIRLARCCCFQHMAEPLVNYLVGPSGIMRNSSRVATAWQMILDKHWDDISSHSRLIAKYRVNIGLWLYLAAKPQEGRRQLIDAAVANLLEACAYFGSQVRSLPFSKPFIVRTLALLPFLGLWYRLAGDRAGRMVGGQ